MAHFSAVTSDKNQKFLTEGQKSGVFGQKASPVGVFGPEGAKRCPKKGPKIGKK